MAIYRVVKDKNNTYVMINKHGIYDNNLSWKAKAILAYCLSRPDNWEFHESEIIKHAKDGIDSTRGGIKELIQHKYIKKVGGRDENGRFQKCGYEIYEVPYDILKVRSNIEIEEVEEKQGENIESNEHMEESIAEENPIKEEELLDKHRENTYKESSLMEKPQKENKPSWEIQNGEKNLGGKIPLGESQEGKPLGENPTLLINNKLNNELSNKRLLLNKDTTTSSGGDTIEDKTLMACKYYEEAGFSTLNRIIVEKIEALIEIYGYKLLREAIDTAVLNNRRNLNYVEGILRKWKANGKDQVLGNRHSEVIGNRYEVRGGGLENREQGIENRYGYLSERIKRENEERFKDIDLDDEELI